MTAAETPPRRPTLPCLPYSLNEGEFSRWSLDLDSPPCASGTTGRWEGNCRDDPLWQMPEEPRCHTRVRSAMGRDGVVERERRTLTGNVLRSNAKGQDARIARLHAPGDCWLVTCG